MVGALFLIDTGTATAVPAAVGRNTGGQSMHGGHGRPGEKAVAEALENGVSARTVQTCGRAHGRCTGRTGARA